MAALRGLLLLWIVLNVAATWPHLARTRVWSGHDSAYYYAQARDLSRDWSFKESLVWHHLFVYPEVSHPAFDYWQPLLPVLVAALRSLTGDLPLAARLALFLFVTVLIPVAQFLLVRSAGGSATAGLAAGALFLSVQRLEYFRTELDTTLFSALFLVLACACAVYGLFRREKPSWGLLFLGGALLACMAQVRGDGLPVALVLIAFLALGAGRRRSFPVLVSLGAGLLLTYSPLVAKNLAQFGRPLPPAASQAVKFDYPFRAFCFEPDQPLAFPPFATFLRVRWEAVEASVNAVQGQPLGFLCLAVMAAALLLIRRPPESARPDSRLVGKALLLVLVTIATFHAVGIALAPATSQWAFRQPIPYWPLLLTGGALATGWLLRQAVVARYRYGLMAFVGVAVIPFIAVNPLRLLTTPPSPAESEWESAARLIPEDAVAMTDTPLALYVAHPAGVVMVPANGERAIARAIDHYRVDYLVLFKESWSTDGRAHTDTAVRDTYRGTKTTLGGGIRLEPLTPQETYRVFRLVRTAGAGAPAAAP
jgi:hypothetical protein